MRTMRAAVLITGLMSLLMPAGASAAAPANDNQATPQLIALSSFRTVNTDEATIEAGEQLTANDANFGCTSADRRGSGGVQMGRTIWYVVRGNGNTMAAASFDSDFDTVLAVYDRTAGTFEGCNDDALFDENGLSIAGGSRVVFDTVAGDNYLIQVGGVDHDGGDVESGVSDLLVVDEVPGNDDRADAEEIKSGTGPIVRDTLGATEEADEDLTCVEGPKTAAIGSTVWFKFVAPSIGTATFTSTGFDTVMQVYAGASASAISCNDDGIDGQTGPSRVSVKVTPGTYLVQIGGYGGWNDFGLNVSVDFAENLDVDGDGFNRPGDCNDGNGAVHPGAPDPLGDGADQNCDGVDGNVNDRDGDGSPAGQDCNDASAAVHPGAPDKRGDRVDQNCDGADGDALDRDGDGFRRPQDCRDNKRKIHPGAKDIPGDGIDQDCKGGDAKPKPLPWGYSWFITPGGKVTKLTVKAAKGAKVTVVCSGAGCPGRLSFKSKGGRRSLKGRFGRTLGSGAVIRVRAVKKGFKGREARIVYRGSRKDATSHERCLKPGSTKTVKC
jgi:Putative metal-binding motif